MEDDLDVFLCKVFIFFQIITFLESKFEEAGWTLKIEGRGGYPIGPSDGVPPWVGRKID